MGKHLPRRWLGIPQQGMIYRICQNPREVCDKQRLAEIYEAVPVLYEAGDRIPPRRNLARSIWRSVCYS